MPKYVIIVTTQSQGIHCGELVSLRASGRAKLRNARRIEYWDGAASVNQIANAGCKKKSRISLAVAELTLFTVGQVIACAPAGEKYLREVPAWQV